MMTKFIRSFLVCFYFALFGTVSLFYNFILFPFINANEKDNHERLSKLSNIVHKSWVWFTRLLIKSKVIDISLKNPEKLKEIKNSVIVATHTSYIDVLILISLIDKTTCFVAPKIGNNIFFSNIVKSVFLISGLSVDDFVEESCKMLDNGLNMLIFPSGTRHGRNEIPKLHKGASLVALKSKRNIVPIKIYPDVDFLIINKPIFEVTKKAASFDIEVFEPIKISGFLENKDEITAKKELTKEIEKRLYQ